MKLLIWLLSLKKQKPRDPKWYTENLQTWTPYEDARIRAEIQAKLRRDLGKETP